MDKAKFVRNIVTVQVGKSTIEGYIIPPLTKTMSRLNLLVVTVAIISASLSSMGSAFGQEISIICQDEEGNYALGTDPVKLGAEISCFVNPSEITASADGQIIVTSPSGETVIDQAAAQSGTTPFNFIASEAGSYLITATFIDFEQQVHEVSASVRVSSNVIPESPIGAIAMVVSAISALLGFTALRSYRKRT